MTYVADFYDRAELEPGDDNDGFEGEVDKLRCRPCGATFARPRSWMDAHSGEHVPCPNCSLDSRIPTADEKEWPDRKLPGDPMKGVPQTERPIQGHPHA